MAGRGHTTKHGIIWMDAKIHLCDASLPLPLNKFHDGRFNRDRLLDTHPNSTKLAISLAPQDMIIYLLAGDNSTFYR
jgi:hypothetical protein